MKDIKVSVNVKEANIEEILKISLKGTKLMYQIKGRNINILPVQNQVQQSKVKKEPIWVKGTVLDENGLPLPGVNILIEGSAIGTITDIDGRFSIQVPELKSILSFSYLGYVTQKLSVNASRDLKVIMGENSQVLSEVVVVGYGVQKKETVTGAISSISNKEIVKSPVGLCLMHWLGAFPDYRLFRNPVNPVLRSRRFVFGESVPILVIKILSLLLMVLYVI